MSARDFTAHDYLLGELSGGKLAEAERLVREDPAFAAEVERLRPVVTELEHVTGDVWAGIPPLEPASEPAGAATGTERRKRRIFGLSPGFAAGIAAAAAALVIAVVLVANGGEEDATTLTLAAVPGSGAEASGSAELGGAGETASVQLAGLESSREGEFYELWMLNDAEDLVSLGSFRVERDGETEVELPIPVDPSEYGFLDVSVEADDGDASHSGDSVLRGPISSS